MLGPRRRGGGGGTLMYNNTLIHFISSFSIQRLNLSRLDTFSMFLVNFFLSKKSKMAVIKST